MSLGILTLRIWAALSLPDESNPLFARVRAQPAVVPGARFLRPIARVYTALSVLISALLVIIAPLALLVVSNVLGALVAFNVTSTINREREQGTYDLLALTPMGLGNANWLIGVATIHRLHVLERLASLRVFTITATILLMLALLAGTVISAFALLALLLAIHIDVIQSQIVGCLSGMLAQQFEGSGSPFAAVAIFVFAQIIAVYLPATATAILLYNALRGFALERWVIESITALVAVLLIFALHEIVIRWMWRALERRLL